MKKITLYIVAFLLISSTSFAGIFITAKDFAKEMKSNKSLVIIDANSADNYAKAHINGAISIPHKSLYKDGDIEGLIRSPENLAKFLGSKGVSNTAPIVVYDDGSNKYSTRVYWVLKYLGAENVRILHKDMNQFKAARIMLSRTPVKAKATTFTANVNPKIFAKIEDVKAAKANTVIVDARSDAEYKGVDEKKESKGHIKGAVNLEYKEVLKANGDFKSKEEIQEIASAKGITADKEIIVYCIMGVRAAVVYVAIADILEYPNVRLYDGGYAEYSADTSNPIEK
ncbi:sulfurtransferase [Bacteroidota bacterium]